MRISDWSSDVCSSDLARLRRGVHRHRGQFVAVIAQLLGGVDEALAVDCGGVARQCRDIEHVVGDHRHGAVQDVDEGLLVTTRPVARSEEHTSELQSLMRISYAVFCLKKNN